MPVSFANCIIRTAIERNYRKINDIMRMEYRGLLSMPEIIPASICSSFQMTESTLSKSRVQSSATTLSRSTGPISDRINNCKSLFPIWINWAYIKELFIMPNGLTEDERKMLRTSITQVSPTTPIKCTSTMGTDGRGQCPL